MIPKRHFWVKNKFDYCDRGQIIKVTTPLQVNLSQHINLIVKYTVVFNPQQSNPSCSTVFPIYYILNLPQCFEPQDQLICKNIKYKAILISSVFCNFNSLSEIFTKWYFWRILRWFYRLLDLTFLKHFHFISNVHVDDDLNDFLRN